MRSPLTAVVFALELTYDFLGLLGLLIVFRRNPLTQRRRE
jgi:H+/Cl- antiporter ClcA